LRKPLNKTKIIAIASLTLLIALAIPMTNAQTAAITFDPASAEQYDSVTVEGTGFAATSAVGIGLGEEITVTWEAHEIVDVAVDPDDEGVYGPFTATTLHYPIKPGSFSFHCDVSDVTSDYYDDYGNGTLNTTSIYAVDPFVNCATGEFGRSTNSPWDTYTVVFYANYTYYEYGVTPDAGVTTDPSGSFTAEVTVPNVLGDYTFTAVDEQGNFATSTQTLEVVPEGLTFGVMALLSSVAVVVGSRYLWNRSRKREK
jgi:hypothetical protein